MTTIDRQDESGAETVEHVPIVLHVNGHRHELAIDTRTSVLDLLREASG